MITDHILTTLPIIWVLASSDELKEDEMSEYAYSCVVLPGEYSVPVEYVAVLSNT